MAVLVVSAVVVVAVPAVALGGPAAQQVETNGTFGQQISSFMQASAADADQSADRGMWQVRVNESANRTAEVSARARTLEERLQRLRDRSQRLTAQYENDTLPAIAYTARASAIRAQMANLRASVDETDRVAASVGVNDSRLTRLRRQANNMSGPEVAAFARRITDAPRGPPAGMPGGPPADRGPGVPGADGTARGGMGPGNDPGNGMPGRGNATDGAAGGGGNEPPAPGQGRPMAR